VVYCHPPPGYESSNEEPYICRVTKPIYGMAQAGRRWQRTIFPWFQSQDLKVSTLDTCVFHRSGRVNLPDGTHRYERLIVGCYVDDLFILSSHYDEHSLYSSFTTALKEKWAVEDEGEISDLLNVEISREGEYVVLRQGGYIDKLVSRFLTQPPTRVVRTPCIDALPSEVDDAIRNKDAYHDPHLIERYRSIVGALNYCAQTSRPDIAYSVGMLSRALSCPTIDLEASARRVVHYTCIGRVIWDFSTRRRTVVSGDSLILIGQCDTLPQVLCSSFVLRLSPGVARNRNP
jgi:hypothetical protein